MTKNIQKETIREIKKRDSKKVMTKIIFFSYRDMSQNEVRMMSHTMKKMTKRDETFETFFMVPVVTFSGFKNELK